MFQVFPMVRIQTVLAAGIIGLMLCAHLAGWQSEQ